MIFAIVSVFIVKILDYASVCALGVVFRPLTSPGGQSRHNAQQYLFRYELEEQAGPEGVFFLLQCTMSVSKF